VFDILTPAKTPYWQAFQPSFAAVFFSTQITQLPKLCNFSSISLTFFDLSKSYSDFIVKKLIHSF